ncbi:MAG TPA: nif11-like peptide radical SAM maturase [Syntrophomonadaceae bacterium]|nr:nif11-like peptide radical SAM maturase [Syntrophomonadaceae bacterium]
MDKKDIMPFHLFQHQGKHYLINIERMCTSAVDETTAEVLEMMVTQPETLLPLGIEEKLKKLGITSEGSQKRKEPAKKDTSPITYLCLLLTQSCNLKCIYCYGDAGKYGTGGKMDEKTAFQAVDWFIEKSGNIKKLRIIFFGGEPFLNFSLMKAVVEYAEKSVAKIGKKVTFNVTSNGTLLDDEKIAFIKEHRLDVMISFDGPKDVQDAQRPYANGHGSFDSTVPKIKRLLEVLPEAPAHAVIMGNTDPESVKDALEVIGFTRLSIAPSSKSLFTEEMDGTKQARDTHTLVGALEEESETWLHLIKDRDSEALKKLTTRSELYKGLISLLHNAKRHHACGAGRSLVAVSSSGDVYLCHRFVGLDEYRLGSICDQNLNREEYQKSLINVNEICGACFARYYCGGGCKHDNASSCGLVSTPDKNMCRLKCRELELAATIISRLDTEDRAFLVDYKIFPPKPCPLDF